MLFLRSILFLLWVFPLVAQPEDPRMMPYIDKISESYGEVDSAICPGLDIAASCGNYSCSEAGEDAETCPSDCTTYLLSSYNSLPICYEIQQVLTPANAAEISQIIKQAIAAHQRVRVVGERHSATTLICGDGIAISMAKFADASQITVKDNVAIIPANATMGALGDALQTQGYSIGYSHLGFRDATVAGALGTSSHGSSPSHTNSIAHRLAFVELVDATGTVQNLTKENTSETIWRGLQTHLGYLGVITKVGLRVEPAFNLHVDFSFHGDYHLFSDNGPLDFLQGCDWGQINWFPGSKRLWRWCGQQTTLPAEEGAENRLLDPGLPPSLVPLAKEFFHASTCSSELLCSMEWARYEIAHFNPPMVVDDIFGDKVSVDEAVGMSHKMMSARFPTLGHNLYFQMDWEVAVPQQHILAALQDAELIFNNHNTCLPAVGVFLRFGLIEDGGYLTYHGASDEFRPGDTAMFFEMPITMPAGVTQDELNAWVGLYRDLTILLIEKYGARAHWGKNAPEIFAAQIANPIYQERMDLFNQAVALMDPTGLFSNAYGEAIGVKWPLKK